MQYKLGDKVVMFCVYATGRLMELENLVINLLFPFLFDFHQICNCFVSLCNQVFYLSLATKWTVLMDFKFEQMQIQN